MSGFEVVGAVVAAGQLIEQGLKIGILVKSIHDQIQDAPEEIQQRLERLESLRVIVQRIRDAPSLQTVEAERILTRCDGYARSLCSSLEAIGFETKDSLGKKTWRAVCGLYQEKEILKLFETLDQEQGLVIREASHTMEETLRGGFSLIEAKLGAIEETTDFSPDSTKCLKALFTTDPSDDRAALRTAKGDIVAGTCDWVTQRNEFDQWQASEGGLLWISGGPGMGKTMLSIYLTEHLEGRLHRKTHEPRDILIYFFCDLKDNKRNNAISIIRGLLFQLVEHNAQLLEHLLVTYKIQGDQLFQEGAFEALWKIFLKIVNDPNISCVSCIIDGLDECEPASLECLLAKIKLIPQHTSKLRIILMSREHPKCIETSLGQFPRIRLDPDAKAEVSSGLEQYISTRVADLARDGNYPAKLTSYVKETLREHSKGKYLWVSFVIKDLSIIEVSDVEAHLDQLPQGLDAYYERMLQQVEPNKQTLVCSILRWCTFAARPLELEELGDALGIQQSKSLSREEILRGNLACCGHFVALSEMQRTLSWTTSTLTAPNLHTNPACSSITVVGLVHQSAYDFLTQRLQALHANIPWFSFCDVEQEQAQLASLCLEYFANKCFKNQNLWKLRRSPIGTFPGSGFLDYAAEVWPQHFRLSGPQGTTILDDHAEFFCAKSPVLDIWLSYMEIDVDGPGTLFHVAAKYGLCILMRELLGKQRERRWKRIFDSSRRSPIHALDRHGNTPLHQAANSGELPIVKMLVKNKARLDAKNNVNQTSLFLASSGDFRKVAEYLLKSGADVNGGKGSTPLSIAIFYEHSEMVKVLLEWNANPFIADEFRSSPLLDAMEARNESMLRDLLSHCTGSQVRKLTDNGGRGALHVAAQHKNLPAMRILLDQSWCLDVNQRDNQGMTPLHLAATQILLEQPGINPNLPDHRGDTPLMVAIHLGHTKIVKLMAKDWSVPLPEPSPDRPSGAIHMAACNHDRWTALRLLNFMVRHLKVDSNLRTFKEAHYDAQEHQHYGPSTLNSCHETALSIAIREGRPEVIEFFLKECKIDPKDSCRSCDGALPLHVAAESNHAFIVKLLAREWSADVNGRDNLQQTPLHSLFKRPLDFEHNHSRRQRTIKALLEVGVQVSAKDSSGCTARDILVSAEGSKSSDGVRMFDELVRLHSRKDVEE
ncbi:ankyrin repeat-containing domain protein [Thelonectria olida]|uniref:Ankyrin repeat-containing domain protein n=1 Tax=Thelonectria olida TaxID=1576542 RepID=A0A9P8VQU7_9HYPO|nr:ankyrin repeat-containing domain protein [Thelonectria olida]